MSAVGKELPPNSDDEAAESPGPSGFSAKGNSAWKRLRMCVRKLVDLANGFNAISGSVMTIITIATAFGIFRVVLAISIKVPQEGLVLPSPLGTRSSSPTAQTPTPASTPSFDAKNYIKCPGVDIYANEGFSFAAGCGQQQRGGSADLRYLDSQILAGPGGQLVESYPPSSGGPISFFYSCIHDATPLTEFDTKAAQMESSFCYLGRRYRVFAKYVKHVNGYVNLSSVYIWRST